MRTLFSPDSPVMSFITRIVSSVWLNILWFVCCLPIITAGASTTALFYVTLKLAQNEEGNITQQFFRAFRSNFRFSTKVWLILLSLGIVLGLDAFVLIRLHHVSVFWTLITAVFIVAAIAYSIVLMYIFPLMARFDNSLRNMFLNSIMIGMRYLLCTLLMAVIYFLMFLIIVRFFTPAVIFGEGLCALLCSHLLLPVLGRISPKEEADNENDET